MIRRKLVSLFLAVTAILSVFTFGTMPTHAAIAGQITIAVSQSYSYSLYVNGTYVNSGMGDGLDVKTFTVNLQPGQNAVSILHHRVSNLCDQTTGGVMADLNVGGTHYVTNSDWKAHYVDYAQSASNPSYDCSTWANAWLWGNANLPSVVPGMPAGTTAQWIWINDTASQWPVFDRTFRFVFDVPYPADTAKVQFYNQSTQTVSNTLYTNFKLVNNGTTPLNLADVKIKYFFSNDGVESNNFWIDWTSIGSANITSTFSNVFKPGTDRCLEIGFNATAGTLAPGASVEIKGRVTKSNWSNFDQSNDYSFNPTATGYTDWNKVTSYIKGVKNWGNEPI